MIFDMRNYELFENINNDITLDELNKMENIMCRLDVIPDILSKSRIKRIWFGLSFNSNINNIPDCVEEINFGYEFNQEIDKYPDSLKYIKFSNDFNQKVDNLPPNVIHIIFGNNFNQSIDNLPDSVKYIEFGGGSKLTHRINKFPKNLTHLSFDGEYNFELNNLPNTISHLNLSKYVSSIDKFPDSIKKLNLGYAFNKQISKYPKNLEVLMFERSFNQPINNLPDSIKFLQLSENFNLQINKFPKNLKFLVLNYEFNQPLKIPEGLEYLVLGEKFNHSICLPKSIINYSIENPDYDFQTNYEDKKKYSIDMLNNNYESVEDWFKIDDLKKNLYAKKIIFNLVNDIDTIKNVHHSYLYDYSITGDDMFQLDEKDKSKLLTNFDEKHGDIYLIKEEYIPIDPEKIEIVEKSTSSNNWAYDDCPINEVTEWTCIDNIEWKNYDETNIIDTGFHLNELYRKNGEKFIHEPNSKCTYSEQKFLIARLVEDLFDKQLKSSFMFSDVDGDY